jgi:hypothetical protein
LIVVIDRLLAIEQIVASWILGFSTAGYQRAIPMIATEVCGFRIFGKKPMLCSLP